MTPKKLMHGAGLLAIAAGCIGPVAAQTRPATYVGVHLGAHDLDRWPGRVDFGGPTSDGHLSLDAGGIGGLLVGRQYGAMRYELEYQHGRFDVEGASLGGLSGASSGSGHFNLLTLGAYWTAPLGPRVTGFAGGAVGAARVSLPSAGFTGCNCFAAASRSGWAAQLRAGVDYEIATGTQVFGQFTALQLPGPRGGSAPSVSYDRRTVLALGIGLRRAF